MSPVSTFVLVSGLTALCATDLVMCVYAHTYMSVEIAGSQAAVVSNVGSSMDFFFFYFLVTFKINISFFT